MPELSTKNDKLAPPEKERGRTGPPSNSECKVASVIVSDNEGEASPRTIEVQISTAPPRIRRTTHRKMKMTTPWEKQNEAAHYRQNQRKGERTGTRQEKARREYELDKKHPQDRQEEKHREKKRRKRRNMRRKRNRKRNFAHSSKKTQSRKVSREAAEKDEEQKDDNRVEELRRELEKTRKELTRDLRNLRGQRSEGRRTREKTRG